jgi:phosphoglucomutase
MATSPEIQAALSGMILSSSGWRGIFAAGEESREKEIDTAHRLIAAGAAQVFADYLVRLQGDEVKPLVLVGFDTRPTGPALAGIILPVLLACGCRVRYTDIIAAPEIMAWARDLGHQEKTCGFIYISASHNPIGHNGFKFGLSDGGVLPAGTAQKLTENFRSFMADPGTPVRLEKLIADTHSSPITDALREALDDMAAAKEEALNAYFNFSSEVAWGTNPCASSRGVDEKIQHVPAQKNTTAYKDGSPPLGGRERCGYTTNYQLGICCDFNGSARCVSIDQNFFEDLGIQFKAINARPGEIVHRIVPEGESLDPCRVFLEEQHRRDPSFVMGYVPDCDGDRGNLVIWDENLQKARTLEAQEVFALACVAELAHLRWGCGNAALGSGAPHIAIAVNDPTSLRIDRIAAAFGAEVFRAEVGEANVVGLARLLREKNYTVRILGEGSAGGNITHPSAVRDPLHTVMALAKLLSWRSAVGKPGLFEIWCNVSSQTEKYRPDYDLADIIASLPPFVTTGAYAPSAALNVTSADHAALKGRYQGIFLREWEKRKDELKARYGIYSWEAAVYNGMEEKKGISNFADAGKGGLKICFNNANGAAIASIWMRGSATEPVFRILADVDGAAVTQAQELERDLIEWQCRMTIEADRS